MRNVMTHYYVNKNAQANGDHEVHSANCTRLPLEHNRDYLGDFVTCSKAVTEAKKTYSKANGCYYCSSSCHTS
ncbi:hypothetical protein BST98_17695 [Photobacterium damselae]|nr:hypothetical protein BST98_17695 [Photobacterium damselae]